jgi:hypothetical protein
MQNLFNSSDTQNILSRLEKIKPDAQKQWGKMNVSQMLAHCNASLETAMGLNSPEKLNAFLRFIGKILKGRYFGERPFMKNSQTDETYIITGTPDFETAKQKVMAQVRSFSAGGPAQCTTRTHVFFGALTPEEWAMMQWKHFDHHLRQFGL